MRVMHIQNERIVDKEGLVNAMRDGSLKRVTGATCRADDAYIL